MFRFVVLISFLTQVCGISHSTRKMLFPKSLSKKDNFITVEDSGQLGNACFRVAAGLSYALDNGYAFVINKKIKKRYPVVFFRVPFIKHRLPTPKIRCTSHFKGHPEINGSALITGYPHSNEYFYHNMPLIRELLGPSKKMELTLRREHKVILDNPSKYVGLHLRTLVARNEGYVFDGNMLTFKNWAICPGYYRDAMNLCDPDSVFVVFSDNIPVAKRMLASFDRKFIFIENSSLYEDFYLISMMKTMIVPNSTFSLFAALLNENSSNVVIKPNQSVHNDINLPNWVLLDYDRDDPEIEDWYKICVNAFRAGRY